MYQKIKDMMWPAPGKRMDDIGWKIRYSERITISDRILAASIIDAYKQMIQDPQKKRNFIVSELRKGPG